MILSHGAALVQAVNELEAAFGQSADLANGDFAAQRHRAVAMRKAISEKITELGHIGSRAFAEPTRLNEFRTRLSALRGAVTRHYAS